MLEHMCGCLGVGGYITKNPNSQIKSCGCSTLFRYFQQMTKPGAAVSAHKSVKQYMSVVITMLSGFTTS